MTDPISTLLELNAITQTLEETEMWINAGRVSFPNDQLFQLEMDRRQSDVDAKRALVEALKYDIRSRN